MKYRERFVEIRNEFRKTSLYAEMLNTVEGSPWHREANVAVHTEMVVDQFVVMTDRAKFAWDERDFYGALACLFHDTGKPAAKTTKFHEERGEYFAFHGHETISARLFEDYAVQHLKEDISSFGFFMIAWMVDNHMPWSVKVKEKRDMLALTANVIGLDVYTRALLADQYGRIADDQESKDRQAVEWVAEFTTFAKFIQPDRFQKTGKVMYMPICASGTGKSTLSRKLKEDHPDMKVFSLDDLRHEWYDKQDYAKAFAMSVEDNQFDTKSMKYFIDQIKDGDDVVIYMDNTNLSAKRRKRFLAEGRKRGFELVAVLIPIDVQTVLDRQFTRGDKCVPDFAVRNQYFALQTPSYGEFDRIEVVLQ